MAHTTGWINPVSANALPDQGSNLSFTDANNALVEDGSVATGAGYRVGGVILKYDTSTVPSGVTFTKLEWRIKSRVIQSGDGGTIYGTVMPITPTTGAQFEGAPRYATGTQENTTSIPYYSQTFTVTDSVFLASVASGAFSSAFFFVSGYGSQGLVDVMQVRITFEYNVPSTMGTSTYYFSGEDYMRGGLWYREEDGFDGNFTFGDNGSYMAMGYETESTEFADYALGVGTTAPTTGADISLVKFRIKTGYNIANDSMPVWASVWSGTEKLSHDVAVGSDRFGDWSIIRPPTGGWTWQKIRDLSIRFWGSGGGGGGAFAYASGAQLRVQYPIAPAKPKYKKIYQKVNGVWVQRQVKALKASQWIPRPTQIIESNTSGQPIATRFTTKRFDGSTSITDTTNKWINDGYVFDIDGSSYSTRDWEGP